MNKQALEALKSQLQQHQHRLQDQTLTELFAANPERFTEFSTETCGLCLDYSKNLVDAAAWQDLLKLCEHQQLSTKISSLFAGDPINFTEARAARHWELRHRQPQDIIHQARQKMFKLAGQIHRGEWQSYHQQNFTDVVNIGIGGSDLGPKLACDALQGYANPQLNLHFISNMDPQPLADLLKKLNPQTTLFLIASKSFTTAETLGNMHTAKQWLTQHSGTEAAWQHQAIAITARVEAASKQGFTEEMILPLWDFVGGRYSLWSCVGFALCLSIGESAFQAFLAGAEQMDKHYAHTDFAHNMPVILSLLEIWYRNYWGCHSQGIIPYAQALQYLPAYLQQLVMESNGKQVNSQHKTVDDDSCPVIWGEVGSNCQHSFMQWLHQGTTMTPVDFIAIAQDQHNAPLHRQLLAHCFSQSQVLMQGKSFQVAYQECIAQGMEETQAKQLATHKTLPGNRPSNTLLLKRLEPQTLGALIALYEHKVFTSAMLWDINPFDQWGVEMGKVVAQQLTPYLLTRPSQAQLAFDGSTNQLIQKVWEYTHRTSRCEL